MEIKIYDIESEGIDLKYFVPEDEGFAIGIELELGLTGAEMREVFRFTLCDKSGLLKYKIENDLDYSNSGIISLNDYNLLVMKNYDYNIFISKLNLIFEESVKDQNNWKTIAKKLNKYFYWEYQNDL